MNTPLSQSPYIREQRQFPFEDIQTLARQVDQAYIDIANKINARTIGIFAVNVQVITGEQWYLTGQPQKQQTLRQVYTFGTINTGAELDIPTNITNFSQFTRIYGVANTVNGSSSGDPDYRPLPYAGQSITNNITLIVGIVAGIQQIRIIVGSTSPALSGGVVVLEWLSQF